MPRSHRFCCGRCSPKTTERRNPGRNGPEWKSKTFITDAEIGDDCSSIFEEELLDCDFEDDLYSEHVTRIIVSIMDIARPAKQHLRNILKTAKHPAAKDSEGSSSNMTWENARDLPLDDEEFEILDDNEHWEDDWEEISDERRDVERVTYASVLRGKE